MKKKIMKKADGGGIGTSRMPSSVSLPASARVPTSRPTAAAAPAPNAAAMQNANVNAPFRRPSGGGTTSIPSETINMKKGGHARVKKADGGMMYTGGSKNFDETTGTTRTGSRPSAPSGLSRALPSQANARAGEARAAALSRFQGKNGPVMTPGGGGTGTIPTKDYANPETPTAMKKGGKAKWIQGAIKKPGALRSALGAKKGQPIAAGKLAKAANSKNPKMAKRANLAMTLRGMKKK